MQLISDSFYGGIKNITSSSTMQKTSENVKYFGQSYLVEGQLRCFGLVHEGVTFFMAGFW